MSALSGTWVSAGKRSFLEWLSSQYHFIANTNSVHKRHINKKVMEYEFWSLKFGGHS